MNNPGPTFTTATTTSSSLKSGLVTSGVLAAYSLVIGNPFVVRALMKAGGFNQGYEWRAIATYLKWNLPAARGRSIPRNLTADLYWPDTFGSRAMMTFSVRDERWAHVGAQAFRTIISILLAGLFVHVAINATKRGAGFIVKWLSAWGALTVALSLSAFLGNIAFFVLQGRFRQTLVDGLLGGFGFGAQFAMLIGAPIAALAAAIHQNRSTLT